MAVSVSIIVPCYNVAPYVDACMDSLVARLSGILKLFV